jgi:hypothetical protein
VRQALSRDGGLPLEINQATGNLADMYANEF